MPDLDNTLMMHGFEAMYIFSKMCVDLIIDSTTLELRDMLVFLMIYGIPKILRYNLDLWSCVNWISFESMKLVFLIYFSIILRSDWEATLSELMIRL